MYKAKPRLVIMYDSSNKGYAVGAGLIFIILRCRSTLILPFMTQT